MAIFNQRTDKSKCLQEHETPAEGRGFRLIRLSLLGARLGRALDSELHYLYAVSAALKGL